jgi:hypothetical protein
MNTIEKSVGPQFSQSVMQTTPGFVFTNLNPDPVYDRPGIQTLIHLHDADPGFMVTGFYCPLNGGRPTPTREQGSMDVPATKFGQLQDFFRQDQPIGDNDHQVRSQF